MVNLHWFDVILEALLENEPSEAYRKSVLAPGYISPRTDSLLPC